MSSLKQRIPGRMVQNGGFCFEPVDPCNGCDELGACLAAGEIKQLAFEDHFLLEDMDYSFLADTNIQYQASAPFVELLCLDSIDATDCMGSFDAASVHSGIYVNVNNETQGELHFRAEIPIRGMRIVVREHFLKGALLSRFPAGALDFLFSGQTRSGGFQHPGLRLIFSQIKNSMRSGIDCEIYYESKIIEILCLISSLSTTSSGKTELSAADRTAVNQVCAILDEHYSDAPSIARLAVITGTSRAKLQTDFKTVCECTIHDYLQSIRMTKALDQIEHSQAPLYSVARDVGYRNPGRFSELFRETYGVTPDSYRKNLNR